MKIEILDEAEADLIEGYHFYEAQDAGLGSYFLDSLFSDIDSLLIHAGVHAVVFDIGAVCRNDFLSLSIIRSREH